MIWAARARSLVCGLLVLVVLLYLCPSWLPPARRLDSAKLPVLTRTNQIDAHTEIRHGAGCKLIPVCFARRVHSPQAMHAMSGMDQGHVQVLRACQTWDYPARGPLEERP